MANQLPKSVKNGPTREQIVRERESLTVKDGAGKDESARSSLDVFTANPVSLASSDTAETLAAAAAARRDSLVHRVSDRPEGTEPNQAQTELGMSSAGHVWNHRDAQDLTGQAGREMKSDEEEDSPFDTAAFRPDLARLAVATGADFTPSVGGFGEGPKLNPIDPDAPTANETSSSGGAGSDGISSGAGPDGPAPFGPKWELQNNGKDVSGYKDDQGSTTSGLLGNRLASIGNGAEFSVMTGLVAEQVGGTTSPDAHSDPAASSGTNSGASGAAASAGTTVVNQPPVDVTIPEGLPIDDASTEEETIQVEEFIPTLERVAEVFEAAAPYVVAAVVVAGAIAAAPAVGTAAVAAGAMAFAVSSGTEGPGVDDQTSPDADPDMGGKPTPGQMAFQNYLRSATGYHRLQDGEGATNPTAESSSVVTTGTGPAVGGQELQHVLVGQPGAESVAGRGHGPLQLATPHDVDPSQDDDTSQGSGGLFTQNPEDVSFGSNTIGIGGVVSSDDDDEEDDESDA